MTGSKHRESPSPYQTVLYHFTDAHAPFAAASSRARASARAFATTAAQLQMVNIAFLRPDDQRWAVTAMVGAVARLLGRWKAFFRIPGRAASGL